MSGRFHPSVRFPLDVTDCKSSRIQIDPIFCQGGYGILVKVILGIHSPNLAYEYERIVQQFILTQSELPDDQFCETASEFFEGFYYNKVTQDVVVPLAAMILNVYFHELIVGCQLDLSEYFLDLQPQPSRKLGYAG